MDGNIGSSHSSGNPELEEKLQKLQIALEEEYQSLGRVYHRLVVTEQGQPLHNVLALLLPRLLSRIGSNHLRILEFDREFRSGSTTHASTSPKDKGLENVVKELLDKIHGKYVEMLGHIMKRTRPDDSCSLPCDAIIELLVDKTSLNAYPVTAIDAFTLNLSLAFLTLALPRCSKKEIESLLPKLISLMGVHSGINAYANLASKSRSSQVVHLVLRAIEIIVCGSVKTNSPRENLDETNQDYIDEVRLLLSRNPTLSTDFYDLLLDILLYQPAPINSSSPPPGLSQCGSDRLKSGSSTITTNWNEEFASSNRLRDLKLAVLDFIAPSRRWAPFFGARKPENWNNASADSIRRNDLNISRTIALLVIAVGDQHIDVSERARTFMSSYIDSLRGKHDASHTNQLLVFCELLSLCLGENISQRINFGSKFTNFVGLRTSAVSSETMRRMLAEKSTLAVLNYVATNILGQPGNLLASNTRSFEEAFHDIEVFGLMVHSIVGIYLDPVSPSNGTIFSQFQIKSVPSASAQVLSGLCIQLSAIYEQSESMECGVRSRMQSILYKSLRLAFSFIAVASTPHSGDTSKQSGIETRNFCYDAICTVLRSSAALDHERMIFDYEALPDNLTHQSTTATHVSFTTAKTLFGCAAYEDESLRIRAIGALDALLFAAVKMLKSNRLKDTTSAFLGQKKLFPLNEPNNLVGNDSVLGLEFTVNFRLIAKSITPLLWKASSKTMPKHSRLAAAHWATEFVLLIDTLSACRILCYLAGDSDDSIAVSALRALRINDLLGEKEVYPVTSIKTDWELPPFTDVISAFFSNRTQNDFVKTCFFDFPPRGKGAALQFCVECLLNDTCMEDEAVGTFLSALFTTIGEHQPSDGIDLLETACSVLSTSLLISSTARAFVGQKRSIFKLSDVAHLASSIKSPQGRKHLSSAYYYIISDVQLWNDQQNDIDQWLSATGIHQILEISATKLTISKSAEDALGFVILAAHCVKSLNERSVRKLESTIILDRCWIFCAKIVAALGVGTSHSDEFVGITCASCLCIIFSCDDTVQPILDYHLHESVVAALFDLCSYLASASKISQNRLSVLIEAAGCILSITAEIPHTSTFYRKVEDTRRICVDRMFDLLSLNNLQHDSLLGLQVGQAFANLADNETPNINTSTSETVDMLPVNDDKHCAHSPPNYVLRRLLETDIQSSNLQRRQASVLVLFAILARTITKVRVPSNFSSQLIENIFGRLEEIQDIILKLLVDPKTTQLIVRECCYLSLAACRSLSNIRKTRQGSWGEVKDVWESLSLRLLVSLNQKTSLQTRCNESLVETDEITSSASDLGGLKRLARIAIDVNRPDLFYTLIVLSAGHPVWRSLSCREHFNGQRLLADEWLGSLNDNSIRTVLQPHVRSIIPLILISRYDPDQETSMFMNQLGMRLAQDGNISEIVSEHFLPVLDELIYNMSNKTWKVRLGSCKALSDIILGRTWVDFGGGSACDDEEPSLELLRTDLNASTRLKMLIRATIRSLDDIRSAVREAAVGLSISLKSLIIRLCDSSGKRNLVASVEDSDEASAANTCLPFLLKTCFNPVCVEAAGFSMSCLLGIIDVSHPKLIQPIVPQLIGSLLRITSGPESALLNYLRRNASGDEMEVERNHERLQLQIADRSIVSTAIAKCLDMVPHLALSSQKDVVYHVDNALHSASGVSTRSAVADAISYLSAKVPDAFNFVGGTTSNPTIRLLNYLYVAIDQEKKGTLVRSKLSDAFGSIAKLSPGKAVRSLALKICDSYLANNDNPSSRKSAASAIKAFVERAPNHIADGGPSDIWCKRVLPIAYLGQNDVADIGHLWKFVWNEGGSCVMLRALNDNLGVVLEERLLPYVTICLNQALLDTSWSVRRMACAAITDLSVGKFLCPLSSSFQDEDKTRIRLERRSQACRILLTTGANIMGKRLYWKGKSDLVHVLVTIIGDWLQCDTTHLEAVPVSREIGYWNDLFVGDRWFERNSAEKEEKQEPEHLEHVDRSVASSDLISDDKFEGECSSPISGDSMNSINSCDRLSTVKAVTLSGISRCLLEQVTSSATSARTDELELLPYKNSVLESLSSLLNVIQTLKIFPFCQLDMLHKNIYNILIPSIQNHVKQCEQESVPPVLLARMISCFAASFCHGIGIEEATISILRLHVKHSAWTVRESSLQAVAILVQRATLASLRHLDFLETLIYLASEAMKDKKFHRVRFAGVTLLVNLCNRCATKEALDNSADEIQLFFESVLPYKERILILARKGLADNESTVIDVCTKLCTAMSSWP